MSQNNPEIVRSSASYRAEARAALRGRWKAAIIAGLMLALLGGMLFGVSVDFSTDAEAPGYGILTANIGPYSSQTYWTTSGLAIDAADRLEMPGLIPLNAGFIAAAAALSLVYLLLSPLYSLGAVRLAKNLLEGGEISPKLAFAGPGAYWRMAKTLLLMAIRIGWLPFVMMLSGVVLAVCFPTDFIAIPVIAFVVFSVILLIRNVFSFGSAPALAVLRPELTVREAVDESKRIMHGHRGRLFVLGISFIGWNCLVTMAAGVLASPAAIPGMPVAVLLVTTVIAGALAVPLFVYMQTASFAFIRDRAGLGVQPSAEEAAPVQIQPAAPISPAQDDMWTDSTYQPFTTESGSEKPADASSDDSSEK